MGPGNNFKRLHKLLCPTAGPDYLLAGMDLRVYFSAGEENFERG
jgi:hypothetical protein